jgi:hypothetical protein
MLAGGNMSKNTDTALSTMMALVDEMQDKEREVERQKVREARQARLLEMMPRLIERMVEPERQARIAELPFLLLPPRGQA